MEEIRKLFFYWKKVVFRRFSVLLRHYKAGKKFPIFYGQEKKKVWRQVVNDVFPGFRQCRQIKRHTCEGGSGGIVPRYALRGGFLAELLACHKSAGERGSFNTFENSTIHSKRNFWQRHIPSRLSASCWLSRPAWPWMRKKTISDSPYPLHLGPLHCLSLLDDFEDHLVLVVRHGVRLLPMIQVGCLHRPAWVKSGSAIEIESHVRQTRISSLCSQTLRGPDFPLRCWMKLSQIP